jgi:hypothetical protein
VVIALMVMEHEKQSMELISENLKTANIMDGVPYEASDITLLIHGWIRKIK